MPWDDCSKNARFCGRFIAIPGEVQPSLQRGNKKQNVGTKSKMTDQELL